MNDFVPSSDPDKDDSFCYSHSHNHWEASYHDKGESDCSSLDGRRSLTGIDNAFVPHHFVRENSMDLTNIPSKSKVSIASCRESVPAVDVPVNSHSVQDDEMLSWLQYPIDDSFDKAYCSEELLTNSHIISMQDSCLIFNTKEGESTLASTYGSNAPCPGNKKNETAITANAAMAMGTQRAAGLTSLSGTNIFNKVKTNARPTQRPPLPPDNSTSLATRANIDRKNLQKFPFFSRALSARKNNLQRGGASNLSTGMGKQVRDYHSEELGRFGQISTTPATGSTVVLTSPINVTTKKAVRNSDDHRQGLSVSNAQSTVISKSEFPKSRSYCEMGKQATVVHLKDSPSFRTTVSTVVTDVETSSPEVIMDRTKQMSSRILSNAEERVLQPKRGRQMSEGKYQAEERTLRPSIIRGPSDGQSSVVERESNPGSFQGSISHIKERTLQPVSNRGTMSHTEERALQPSSIKPMSNAEGRPGSSRGATSLAKEITSQPTSSQGPTSHAAERAFQRSSSQGLTYPAAEERTFQYSSSQGPSYILSHAQSRALQPRGNRWPNEGLFHTEERPPKWLMKEVHATEGTLQPATRHLNEGLSYFGLKDSSLTHAREKTFQSSRPEDMCHFMESNAVVISKSSPTEMANCEMEKLHVLTGEGISSGIKSTTAPTGIKCTAAATSPDADMSKNSRVAETCQGSKNSVHTLGSCMKDPIPEELSCIPGKTSNDVNAPRKQCEDVDLTSPSRLSGNSTEKSVKEADVSSSKRSIQQPAEDSEIESKGVDHCKRVPERLSGAKRNRAAEIHNLSERKRRNKINVKMKALQELIPNSTKTDKASILDEAIDYMKMLQSQVEMMSLRNGIGGWPMLLPTGMVPALQQRMVSPQLNVSMGYGMGMGLIDASTFMDPSMMSLPVLGQPIPTPAYSTPGFQIGASYSGQMQMPPTNGFHGCLPTEQQLQHQTTMRTLHSSAENSAAVVQHQQNTHETTGNCTQ